MKKLYFTFLIAILPFAMISQTTVNTVKDTLGVVFYAEYTTVASSTGVTLTLNLTENLGALADVAEVEIYRNYGDNRVNGRTRIAKGITDGSSGTVIFVDDSQVWTADTNSATGYTGDGAFNVGTPTAYSVKVIMSDESGFSSSRSIPTVYIPNEFSPTRVVNDVISDDMTLSTRVYENFPAEETALLVIGLAPSTTYPTDPYKFFEDTILARTGNGTVNWSSYPCFVSEIHYNEVADLAGRKKDIPGSRAFYSNMGVTYHLVKKADINLDDIDTDGKTNVSFKFGRPALNGTVSIPIQITSALGINNASLVSTNVKAVGSRVYVSNVKSNTEINIYSITGALVKSLKTNEDTNFSLKSGLWIGTIRTNEGQKSVKLLTN